MSNLTASVTLRKWCEIEGSDHWKEGNFPVSQRGGALETQIVYRLELQVRKEGRRFEDHRPLVRTRECFTSWTVKHTCLRVVEVCIRRNHPPKQGELSLTCMERRKEIFTPGKERNDCNVASGSTRGDALIAMFNHVQTPTNKYT